MAFMKYLTFLFILLVFGTDLFAQYEVSVTTIPVWIKVRDKSGKPLLGLQEKDFELFEDGKRVTSNCFEEINLDRETTPSVQEQSTPPPPEEPQRFVILLDLYNTSPREYAAVKPAIQSFLESLSTKKVEVMLAAFMPDRRLGIVSKFTTDLRRIKIMLDFARANAKRDVVQKHKGDQMKDAASLADNNVMEKTASTSQEDSSIDSYQTARILATQEVDSSRFTLRALETFAENLSRMELKGHTSLILVSGGFSVDPGRRYFNMADAFTQKTGDVSSNQKPQFRQTGFYFRDEMQESIGKLNRLNVTLYTLDTRGTLSEQEYQDSLIQIAQETGGIPFFNSDNFNVGLERVQEDIKHQYLLCYSPPQHKTSGKYHTIRVNVKRSGADARYRDGYWD